LLAALKDMSAITEPGTSDAARVRAVAKRLSDEAEKLAPASTGIVVDETSFEEKLERSAAFKKLRTDVTSISSEMRENTSRICDTLDRLNNKFDGEIATIRRIPRGRGLRDAVEPKEEDDEEEDQFGVGDLSSKSDVELKAILVTTLLKLVPKLDALDGTSINYAFHTFWCKVICTTVDNPKFRPSIAELATDAAAVLPFPDWWKAVKGCKNHGQWKTKLSSWGFPERLSTVVEADVLHLAVVGVLCFFGKLAPVPQGDMRSPHATAPLAPPWG
jgi:hypothetical protein